MKAKQQSPLFHSSSDKSRVITIASCLFIVAMLSACNTKQATQGSSAQPPAPPVTNTPVAESAASGEDAINETAYRRHIETLSSDEFGGRAPASAGGQMTVDYLTQAFSGLGLEPANGASYTQDVPLTLVTALNKPELVFSGGEGEDMKMAYSSDQVIWTRKQVPTAAVQDSELVFVGYGINAPERNWNDYAGLDVKGKTVIMLSNDPGYATQDPELFNGNVMTLYGHGGYKFDEAARQGAAGALIIHDPSQSSSGWKSVINSRTGPQFDMVLPDKGEKLASVEGWIAYESAQNLFSKAGLDLKEMYAKAQQPGLTAVPMALKASATLVNEIKNVNSSNVVAMLRGSEAADEYFIYMAHWDHLGTDPTMEGDNIFNGAGDNASGTAALLEIAKAYATMPKAPRRSVIFLATAAEEQGLLGSKHYAANPLVPLAKTVAGLNMDGINNIGKTRDTTVIGRGMSELDNYLAKEAAKQDKVLAGDPAPSKGYYFRSDHFSLASQGVPMLLPGPGYDHNEKGRKYGMKIFMEYVSNRYHQVSDEYDPNWDLSGAMEDIKIFYRTGLSVANSDDWPNWSEDTKFKVIRDAQLKSAEQ